MEGYIDSLPNLLSLGRHHVLKFQDEKKATWPFSRLNGSVKDLGNQVPVKWTPWTYSLHIIEVVQILQLWRITITTQVPTPSLKSATGTRQLLSDK